MMASDGNLAKSADIASRYRKLRKESARREGLALVQEALRREQIDDANMVSLGQMIAADLENADIKIFVAGQCMTSFFLPILTALGWSEGVRLDVREGHFDNILQDLLSLDWEPDVIVIIPWHQRILTGVDREVSERIDSEMDFLMQIWNCVRLKGAKLLQVGYDWILPGSFGYTMSARPGGDVSIVRRMNESLKALLPEGTFFVDLEQVSATTGHVHFYDQRNYFWMKQPFTTSGLVALNRHLWAGVRALTQGQKKLLILDLDNTLWGGVVAETGPHEVGIGETPEGEAFRSFQSYVKQLAKNGIVLAVCSKNNPEDAREPFTENPNMLLKLDDFAAFEASWDPKPTSIRRIADELRLGLDSFVFFDDNPAEREHVRQELPEVQVVEVPSDPSEYMAALQASLSFEAVVITDADALRVRQYSDERERRILQASTGSLEDYLDSLEMVASVEPVFGANMTRAIQLVTKTNQFNLTVRRHSVEQIREMLSVKGCMALALSLSDKFGDYGVVSIILARPEGAGDLVLDTWLMSCRSIGRTVEHFVLNHIAAAAKSAGIERLIGEYVPAKKNGLVANMYSRFGFLEQSGEGDVRRYVLELAGFAPLPTNVESRSGSDRSCDC